MEHRAYRMRLKKEHITDYVEIHKKNVIWRSVVEGMKKAGFEKMIIFQLGQDLILFEEAPDLKKAYKYYDDDQESKKWDTMISEWMELYPTFDYIKNDIKFEEIPVVFYYDKGELLH